MTPTPLVAQYGCQLWATVATDGDGWWWLVGIDGGDYPKRLMWMGNIRQ